MSHGYVDTHQTPNSELSGSGERPGPEARPEEDQSGLAQVLGALRENVGLVLVVGIVGFVAVLVYTALSPMTFRATGRLYLGDLEEPTPPTAEGAGPDLTGDGHGDIGSEIEILRSRNLVQKAAPEAGTNVDISPWGWERPNYFA